MYSKDDQPKYYTVLWNQHPVQGRLAGESQTLIWNFLICICNMIKDQFRLFLFSQMWKNLSANGTAIMQKTKISFYHDDFVTYCEIVRFESKPWVSQQNRETWQVWVIKNTLFWKNRVQLTSISVYKYQNVKNKWSLKSHSVEHKRSVRNCNYEKNEIVKHCWETDHNFSWYQKKVFDRKAG